MPAKRLSMRKIKEVLRLHANGVSQRKISISCGVSRPAVAEYVRRAAQAGLAWPLANSVEDTELESRLYPPRVLSDGPRAIPDCIEVNRQLKRKSVTLFLLWQEYRARHPNGYQYSWFCEHYRYWLGKRDLVMRQNHRAGEKVFVDYAGQTMPVIDTRTGEIRDAQIFVAVLGASNYTYCEATWTQSLPDWIGSHQRTFEFLGGVPEIVVPDNLKSGVNKAHRYEPDINPTYQDLASHYAVAVIPARVRRPKDKAKAETGVLIVERWILAVLRNRAFFSLGELNRTIQALLQQLNTRPFKKLPGCRRTLFDELDKPALKPLPVTAYVYAQWKKVRVHIDYHVEIAKHYYSVPCALVKTQLDARITERTIECFHKGKRVASHLRSHVQGGHTTLREHMPKSHQQYGDWSPQRLIRWAQKAGPATARLIELILSGRRHPEQGYRSALGVLRLGKAYGENRLEKACERALHLGTYRYKSIESILKTGLDKQPLPRSQTEPPGPEHDNLRGADYYH